MAAVVVSAQPVHILSDSPVAQIDTYSLLPDRGYSFNRVLADTSLHFVAQDSLRPDIAEAYWMKIDIANPRKYAEEYNIWVRPFLINTLYYFNANARKWMAQKGGIMAGVKGRINVAAIPFILQADTINHIYIRLEIGQLRSFGYAIMPKIILEKQAEARQKTQRLWTAWIAGLAVLLLFFINNLYIYFSLRNKAILYHLITQLGGIIYITAYWRIFYLLLHCRVYSIIQLPTGVLWYYDTNFLLMHIAVVMVLLGMVQLTRSFLLTAEKMPKLDAVLKYGLYCYIGLSLVLGFINTTLFHIDYITLLYDNILFVAIIALTVLVSIIAYRRKFSVAGPFLFANLLPLACMLATSLFNIFIGYDGTTNLWIPGLAVVSQALGFSIALVALTKYIRRQLTQKEQEARQLTLDIQESTFKQQLTELENEKITALMEQGQARNELLNQRLETNQRELASSTLYMVQKNEMLAQLKQQVQALLQFGLVKPNTLLGIQHILQSNLNLDADWAKFKIHFEQVHPHFFEELATRYPTLTNNEVRLYTYFYIKLSTKEIAGLLNIDPASVRRAKTRMYKKIGIQPPEPLEKDLDD